MGAEGTERTRDAEETVTGLEKEGGGTGREGQSSAVVSLTDDEIWSHQL